MNKEDLKKQFALAKETGRDIAVELTVPTREAHEFIIVVNDNLDYKLDYYLNNYNDNLELERFTEIKIVRAYIISSYVQSLDLLDERGE